MNNKQNFNKTLITSGRFGWINFFFFNLNHHFEFGIELEILFSIKRFGIRFIRIYSFFIFFSLRIGFKHKTLTRTSFNTRIEHLVVLWILIFSTFLFHSTFFLNSKLVAISGGKPNLESSGKKRKLIGLFQIFICKSFQNVSKNIFMS